MRKVRKSGKLVYGVGIIDADYTVNPDGGPICVFYKAWQRMLERAYSETFKLKHPTYEGVEVCSDWLRFSVFKSWMQQQNYKGKELDKDLLFEGSKIYGPDTCVFVTELVNKFMTDRKLHRGIYPVGVTFESGKFKARCSNLGSGSKYLGLFNTPEEAHHVYKEYKEKLATELAAMQTDTRVAEALIKRYKVEEIK